MYGILVLSRIRAMRELLSGTLEAVDRHVTRVADGDEVLAHLSLHRVSVVVLDMLELDDELMLLAGLIRKRFPSLPVVSLLHGRIRIRRGAHERLLPLPTRAQDLGPVMTQFCQAVAELLAEDALKTWNPATASA